MSYFIKNTTVKAIISITTICIIWVSINKVIKETNTGNINIGKVYSTDVFYTDEDIKVLTDKGCICTEMESFALFYNAYKLGKNAACILTISDNLVNHEETTPEQREKSLNEMITLALESVIKL